MSLSNNDKIGIKNGHLGTQKITFKHQKLILFPIIDKIGIKNDLLGTQEMIFKQQKIESLSNNW